MDDTIVVTALETLILSVLGLGLAIALCSPVSVVTVIILLSMPAGREAGLCVCRRLAAGDRCHRCDLRDGASEPGLQLAQNDAVPGRFSGRDSSRLHRPGCLRPSLPSADQGRTER